jgi:uncharacterized protein YciI
MKPVLLIIIILSAQCAFAQSLVFVFLHYKADKTELPKDQVDKIMEGHMDNIKKMAKEGKLLVAGPFEEGGGIFIFNSSKVDDIKQWLNDDPGVKAQRWNIEIQPYHWRIGKPRLVQEPIEMTDYQFIRFVPYIAKFNINDVPELMKKHDDYLKEIQKTGNVVAEGIFGDTEGGILIIKGDLDKTVIESDPAVHEGLLEIEMKKLYVARGAFGESK